MLSYITICTASMLTAGLTLYSGFGLGTLLMPVFALFFPIELAVAATAVVHGANNIFKLAVVGRHADRTLVLAFGVPAILAAFVGAAALGYISHFGEWARYRVGPIEATVTPLKLAIGMLMFLFAMFELLPRLREIRFSRRYLFVGGLLSGFFGGFSGHQGALRSAFLVKVGVTTQAFVGTNAMIGFLVDMARLATYVTLYFLSGTSISLDSGQWGLVLAAMAAALAGVLIGKRYLHKITMAAVQVLTGVLLFVIAVTMMAGWI